MNLNPLKRYNVKVTGTGSQPVLFAHGMGCDQRVWNYLFPSFEKNYKVIRFDFIGSGGSDISSYDIQKHSSLRGYAEDILEICESLNLQNIIFVGHGVSSMIGMLASISNPQLFSKLIMIAPSACLLNDRDYLGGFDKNELEEVLAIMEENYLGWAKLFSPRVMANPERPLLAKELEDRLCTSDPGITKKFARVSFFSDNRSDLSLVRISTLILQSKEDILAPEFAGRYLHQNIRGSKLKIMKAKGHCPHISEPEETITLMQEFLEDTQKS